MRLFACLLVLAGCASDSGGGVSGQQPGGSFDVADMISATVTTNDNGDTSSYAQIALANTANLCGDAGASPAIDRKGQRFITIELRDVAGSVKTAPTAPGSYTIYPNTGSEPAKSASLEVGGFDDACQEVDEQSASAQSGTVTLSAVTGGVYTGQFSVTLNTGGQISGTFAPTACPQLATAAASGVSHSCK